VEEAYCYCPILHFNWLQGKLKAEYAEQEAKGIAALLGGSLMYHELTKGG
jgi:hypothetical protein